MLFGCYITRNNATKTYKDVPVTGLGVVGADYAEKKEMKALWHTALPFSIVTTVYGIGEMLIYNNKIRKISSDFKSFTGVSEAASRTKIFLGAGLIASFLGLVCGGADTLVHRQLLEHPIEGFLVVHLLLVLNESIGDGAFLFFRGVGVGGELGASGGFQGGTAHLAVGDVGAFADVGPDHVALLVDPYLHHDMAFFGEFFGWALQGGGAASSEVVARAVALTALTVVFLHACQSVGVALVARLTGDAFRAAVL